MIKGKSLSDSSTSESEDDGNRMQHQKSFFPSAFRDSSYSSTFQKESPQKRALCKESSPTFSPNHLTRGFKRSASASGNKNDSVKRPKMELAAQNFSDEEDQSFRFSGSESDDRCSAESEVPIENSFHKETVNSEDVNYTKTQIMDGPGWKMMSKMGYKDGKGLGKHGQGRTEIVEASTQRGRRGLGLHIKGLEPADVKWNAELEQDSVKEPVSWMPECYEDPPSLNELREWKKEGIKKLSIDDEDKFCSPDILKDVLSYKSVFDNLEGEEMRKARTRSNPFETIRGGIFLNRAAMKMANMDACFDFMFTSPKDQSGHSMVGPDELLYFADICAGPGGFSEYVLYRRKWESKGFGFTLKGSNDFKLDEFFSGPPETFEPHYGVNGIDGDGDIYKPQNLETFATFVLNNTDSKGVHFVMADGGFSVESNENLQEILSKRLYLCQFLCALMILRTGGHFTCKLFDLFTPFSVGLVYLMYLAFEKVCIFKPNTSRPANSERYIICKWKKEDTKSICHYMFELNTCFEEMASQKSDFDIVEVVPLDVIMSDEGFFNYIVTSNNTIGARQIIHLDKIRTFAQNQTLVEPNQNDFRKACLAAWKIPDEARVTPDRPEPSARFRELTQGEKTAYIDSQPEPLTVDKLRRLGSIYNYKCVVCGDNNAYRGFFLSLGRSNIYRLESRTSKWTKLDVTLELPVNTLIYGELISELKGEGKAQRKVMCLQVIDALFLGGRDVRNIHFDDRMALARKLAKAVSKPSRLDYTPIKVKRVWQLTEINEILKRLVMKNVKGSGGFPRLCYMTDDLLHFIPSGLLIFDTIASPWVTAYSRSHQRIYYFNVKNKQSKFERLKESAASFVMSFSSRKMWCWERGVHLIPEQKIEADNSALHSVHLKNFIKEKLRA